MAAKRLTVIFSFIVLGLGAANEASATIVFDVVFAKVGAVGLYDPNPNPTYQWTLKATDNNEGIKSTAPQTDPLNENGLPFLIALDDSPVFGIIRSVSSLGGDFITRRPDSLILGEWAVGMGLFTQELNPTFPPAAETIAAYYQLRLAGSSLTVSDTSMAQEAVDAGLWPSVDTYIEFDPQTDKVYFPTTATPTGPSDYGTRFALIPEPSSVTILMLGAVCLTSRWRR